MNNRTDIPADATGDASAPTPWPRTNQPSTRSPTDPSPAEPHKALWLHPTIVAAWTSGARAVLASTIALTVTIAATGALLAIRWQQPDPLARPDGAPGRSAWALLIGASLLIALVLRLLGWWRLTTTSALMDSGPFRPVAWRFCRALATAAAVSTALWLLLSVTPNDSIPRAAARFWILIATVGLLTAHALAGWAHLAGVGDRLGHARLKRQASILIVVGAAAALASTFLLTRGVILTIAQSDPDGLARALAIIVSAVSALLVLGIEAALAGQTLRAIGASSPTRAI